MRAYQRGCVWVCQIWSAGIWCDIRGTMSATALEALAAGRMRYTLH